MNVMRSFFTKVFFVCLLASITGCGEGLWIDGDEARIHLTQADQYLKQGLADSALTAFGQALEQNPNLVEAHMGVGNIYRERGDYPRADRSYQRAVELAPTSFDAHYYLALTKQLLGQLQEAVKGYLQSLAIDPDSFDANQNLAGIYLQMGKPSDALPYAKRATKLNPHESTAWANLGAAYSLLHRYQDAVDAYNYTIWIGEDRPQIAVGLAEALEHMGQFEEAIRVLQELIRKSPSASAYERLGYAQYKLHKFDDALASYRAALSFNPEDAGSLNGLGVSLMTLYIQSNRSVGALRDEALKAWRHSLNVRSNQPRIVDLLTRYQKL